MKSSTSTTKNENGNLLSSASESSDDEDTEEAKRIAAAVCDSSILELFKDATGSKPLSGSFTTTSPQHTILTPGPSRKSNRPVDRSDDDKDSVLHTTPEFRSYVAKQLSQLLDKQLSDSVTEGVWSGSRESVSQHSGVRLFSDSKELLPSPGLEETSDSRHSSTADTGGEKKKRKKCVNLESSSESSEDEQIKACVYTHQDIQRENERLVGVEVVTAKIQSGTSLLKQGHSTGQGNPVGGECRSTEGNSGTVDTVVKKKKKKSKKKKKLKVDQEVT